MSIWAGKQTQAALAAVSARAEAKQTNGGAVFLEETVLPGLDRLISTVNTLKSIKPELKNAGEVLMVCKAQINEAMLVKASEFKQLESPEHTSFGMTR